MAIATGEQALAADVLAAIAAVDIGAGNVLILVADYESIGQGTWIINRATAEWGAFAFTNSSSNNGDNVSYKVFLAKGTYTLSCMYKKGSGQGIVDIDVDGVEKLSFDAYDAGTQYVQFVSQAGIVIAADGFYIIRARVDGKHASSSSYLVTINYIALRRTA